MREAISVLWQTCSTGKACAPQALLVFVLLEPTQRYQPLTRSLTSFCPPETDQILFQGTGYLHIRPNIIPGYLHIPILLFHGTIDPHQHQHVVFNIPKKKYSEKLFLEVTPPWNNLRREGPCENSQLQPSAPWIILMTFTRHKAIAPQLPFACLS